MMKFDTEKDNIMDGLGVDCEKVTELVQLYSLAMLMTGANKTAAAQCLLVSSLEDEEFLKALLVLAVEGAENITDKFEAFMNKKKVTGGIH